jgi:GNAT superfamily N-acetyltransferase
MVELVQIKSDGREKDIQPLFAAYAQWLAVNIQFENDVKLDSTELLHSFITGIEKFYPPQGRLFLARQGGDFVGVGGLKVLEGELGEIKRMFVREDHRGMGLGKAILDRLIAEARSMGYPKIRLDSPKFSTASHGLYRSRGFQPIQRYPGSEVGEEHAHLLVYMELDLKNQHELK